MSEPNQAPSSTSAPQTPPASGESQSGEATAASGVLAPDRDTPAPGENTPGDHVRSTKSENDSPQRPARPPDQRDNTVAAERNDRADKSAGADTAAGAKPEAVRAGQSSAAAAHNAQQGGTDAALNAEINRLRSANDQGADEASLAHDRGEGGEPPKEQGGEQPTTEKSKLSEDPEYHREYAVHQGRYIETLKVLLRRAGIGVPDMEDFDSQFTERKKFRAAA